MAESTEPVGGTAGPAPAPTAAPAAMIANKQPHTVSLPPGSNVAARKSARKPGAGEQAAPARARAAARDLPVEPSAPRVPAPKAANRSARKGDPAPAPVAPPEPMLGDEIVRRIAAVQALNEHARSELARLGDA